MKVSSKNIWDVSHPTFSPESIDVPEAFRKVMENIERKEKKSESTMDKFRRIWQLAASAIAVPALGLAIFFGIEYYRSAIHGSEDKYMQTATTSYGMRTSLTLPDGSRVWLNSGSSLTYPLTFRNKARTVKLSGEAFFEVESDQEHPFIVKTKSLNVTATGTAFNVNSYDSDKTSMVMLERGKLDISSGEESVSLTAGNLLSLNEVSGSMSVKEIDPYISSSWRDGILIFIDTPITDVFKRLGQIYNVNFVIRDSSIASHLYRATFDGDSLNDILDIMAVTSSISFHKSISSDGMKTIEVFSKNTI